jgi:hypothetical protein
MSPSQQLAKEARYDMIVAGVGIVVFFGCLLLLPRSAFWFYFLPLAAFWLRYLFVRDARDEALLRAEILADRGSGAPRCYRTEGGICITDGTHHLLIARQQTDAPLQLPHIVGRQ